MPDKTDENVKAEQVRSSFEMLARLRGIVLQGGDRKQRAQRIAEHIRATGPYRWVGIYDVDTHSGLISNIAWSGPGAPAYPTFPITKGLSSRAIATKKTVNVGDVTHDADYLTALSGTRSEIIIPVLCNNSHCVVGTIDVESERPDEFDSAAQGLLEECAMVLQSFWSENP